LKNERDQLLEHRGERVRKNPDWISSPLFQVEPEALLGDKGYDADSFINSLEVRAIKAVMALCLKTHCRLGGHLGRTYLVIFRDWELTDCAL
jgi:hypothetical protein